MRILAVLLALAAVSFYCDGAIAVAQGSPSGTMMRGIGWDFKTIQQDGNPYTDVYLKAGGKRTLIKRHLLGNFHPVSRSDYSSHKAPSYAVTACSGWWAGQGADFYVLRRSGSLMVFQRDLDEQAETGRYRRVKTVVEHPKR